MDSRTEVLFHSSLENTLEQASKEQEKKRGKHPFTAQTV